ncbi:MAG: proline racemase family protein [Chloroflexi bacterium]|nr:proline racemase family protein [Chloroflexota bacterium]
MLCPGKAYDRSPCGTGISTKLACLYANGKLQAGQPWKQQSVVGSIFKDSVQLDGENNI